MKSHISSQKALPAVCTKTLAISMSKKGQQAEQLPIAGGGGSAEKREGAEARVRWGGGGKAIRWLKGGKAGSQRSTQEKKKTIITTGI